MDSNEIKKSTDECIFKIRILDKEAREWLWSVTSQETSNAAETQSRESARKKIRGFFQYKIYQCNLYMFNFKRIFKNLPLGVERLWLHTAMLEHAVSYIACV